MTNWNKIVDGNDLKSVRSLRSKQYIISKERRATLLGIGRTIKECMYKLI